jgi:hypothetical protein
VHRLGRANDAERVEQGSVDEKEQGSSEAETKVDPEEPTQVAVGMRIVIVLTPVLRAAPRSILT